MKNMILISLLLFCISANSQKAKEIDTLKYTNMIEKSNKGMYRTGMEIHNYLAKDGNFYKVGDTLNIGNPSGINTVGTGLGVDTRYEYLLYGKPAGSLLKGIRFVEGNYRDYQLIIDKIQFNKGTFGLENYVFFYAKPLPNKKFTLIDKVITITMVDTAIDRGEIYPLYLNREMTRDEAISILRSKKEELDLQLLSQEEYDAIKKELLPIINKS